MTSTFYIPTKIISGANALKTAPWLAAHPKKLDKAAIAAIYAEAW